MGIVDGIVARSDGTPSAGMLAHVAWTGNRHGQPQESALAPAPHRGDYRVATPGGLHRQLAERRQVVEHPTYGRFLAPNRTFP